MADQIDQLIRYLKLDTLDSNQSLVFVKQKTTLRPSQIAFALIVFLTIVLIIAQTSTLVICIGCYLIPAYFSFLSLEAKKFQKDVKYLTYWIVFTVSQIFSFFFIWIFGPTIYAFSRIGLTVGLLHPQFNLANKLYIKVISPYVMGNKKSWQEKAEDIIQKGKQKFLDLAEKGKQKVEEKFNKLQ